MIRERISLQIARTLVRSKIRNCRTLLRRHGTRREVDITLGTLRDLGNRALRARDAGQLLGIEGAAAAAYFPAWGNLLDNASGTQTFDFAKRNRRPPTDPVIRIAKRSDKRRIAPVAPATCIACVPADAFLICKRSPSASCWRGSRLHQMNPRRPTT